MFESLCDIRTIRERFPDLPTDQMMQLYTIWANVRNGATWDEIIRRQLMTYLELGVVLMAFDADELQTLQNKEEQNWDHFVERSKRVFTLEERRAQSVFKSSWPEVDEDALSTVMINLPIQINGKKCCMIEASQYAEEHEIVEMLEKNDKLQSRLRGHKIVRIVYVPKRVFNYVTEITG